MNPSLLGMRLKGPLTFLEIEMSEEVKSKGQILREELDNLKLALQTAAGGMDEQVQAIVARMEAVLAPAA